MELLGTIFFELVLKPFEWVVFGKNNDSESALVRPIIKTGVPIALGIWFLLATGLVTIEPKKPVVYQTHFDAVGVENTRCDTCFTAPKGFNPNYTFYANPIIK